MQFLGSELKVSILCLMVVHSCILPRFRQVPVCTNAIITTNEGEHTARPRIDVYLGIAVDYAARLWPR